MRNRPYDSHRHVALIDEDLASDSTIASWSRRLFARPKDFLGLMLVSAAAITVIVNALFLQAGPHPAPIFANMSPPESESSSVTASLSPRQGEISRLKTSFSDPAGKSAQIGKSGAVPIPTGVARPDPISQLLEPSNRMIAVQRALAEFGYGQIKATGIAGAETKAAIEKFERDRKLPVTGHVSERLTRELAAMKGGPL